MELGVFRRSAVAENLEKNFVEARIHTDDVEKPELRELQLEMTRSVQNPIYLIVDPTSRETVGTFERALTPGESEDIFLEFLDAGTGRQSASR